MAEQRGTLATITTNLARLFQPLDERLSAGDIRLLLAELGLQFPVNLANDANLISTTRTAVDRLKVFPSQVADLTTAIKDENIPQILAKGVELANSIRTLIQAIESIANAIKAFGGGIPPAELNQFANELPGRLFDYLIVRNLEGIPGAAESLDFIGFVERTDVPAVDATHPAFVKRALHFNELTSFLKQPSQHLQTKYQWGAANFDGVALLQKLHRLLIRVGVPAILDTTGPAPVLDILFVQLKPRTDLNPRGISLKIAHKVQIDNAQPFQSSDWQVRLVLNTTLGVGAEVFFQPNDRITFVPPSGQVEGDLFAEWTGGKPGGTPYLIIGEPGASRIEAKQLVAKAGVGFRWNAATGHGEGDLRLGGEIKNGKFVVNLGGADGFLGKILSGFGLESDFNVGLMFSTKDGLTFTGSAGLEIQLPFHVTLGPVELSALRLTVGIQGTTFPIGLGVDIKAQLGPLQAVVEQIGFAVDMSFPANRKGNAGPVDFGIRFQPPKGVGLSLDVGIIKGGGYLFLDFEKQEYAGALELVFSGFINLKAIGLINTKMPDGSSGFSLLIIITAEFGTGIQLGFGFTLLGVGGLIGLNRTVKLQPLAEGVRTGAVSNILFPQNVIANAPKIISDLRIIFPPQEGKFLIGPMAKLGWGTPTLISLSFGIIIEIPGNIAILGVLRLALPGDAVPLIVLQVNFIGAIEFDKKRIWFFASLFDSRVLFITLSGEMGILFAFGDDANMVISVGGFHPQFNPPPLPFPVPQRIAINVLNTSFARIRVEGYFAVTSNSVQFGARAEAFFGFDAFHVSGYIGFDALFQFSPFSFTISGSAGFSLKVFGIGMFGIDVSFALSGPTPWRIQGTGSISFFFFDIEVDFDHTWGDQPDTLMPPIAVLPLLANEVTKVDNWQASLPVGTNLSVSLRPLDPTEAAMILHPVGTLRVSQRAVPLDRTITKVGQQKVSDVKRATLQPKPGSGLGKKADTKELFAPAQYQDFDDATKLSKPAYEQENSGLELAPDGQGYASATMIKRVIRYELITIDTNYRRFLFRFQLFNSVLFNHFLHGASVTASPFSQAQKSKQVPFADKIQTRQETYSVAFLENNKAINSTAKSFASEAQAQDYMKTQIAKNPTLAGSVHVIQSFEVAT